MEYAPKDLYEVCMRNHMERREIMKEQRWRRTLMDFGAGFREVLGDLPERLLMHRETNEIRDKRRAEEQERIRRENVAHRERVDNMRPKIDDDTEDDATGFARARLRALSAASRKTAAVALQAQNLEMRQRISRVQAATDNKIWDDGAGSAGAARSIVAAQSRRRRAEEMRRLDAANDEYRLRIASVQAVIDDDITDDVAADGTVGAGRAEAAAASMSRKAAVHARLSAENRAHRAKLRSTGAATDNDITDDVAADGTVGGGRAQAAAASATRKAREGRNLAAANRAHRTKLRGTGAATDNQLL